MKKMTFIIPCFKVKKYITENLVMWKKLSKLINLVFIEDTDKPELKDLVNKIGGRHYSKPNGNWGSVINYAKIKRLIETDYMAIVDPDDTIILSEMEALLQRLGGKDLYITNFNKIFLQSKRTVLDVQKIPKDFLFVHGIWIKTDIFYKTSNLPEGVFFTDNHFIANVVGLVQTWEKIEISPYNYFLELPGQSVEVSYDSLVSKWNSIKGLGLMEDWLENNNIKRNKRLIKKYDTKHRPIHFIRDVYDSTERKNFSSLKKIYKNEVSSGWKPLKSRLTWSMIYRFFKK